MLAGRRKIREGPVDSIKGMAPVCSPTGSRDFGDVEAVPFSSSNIDVEQGESTLLNVTTSSLYDDYASSHDDRP